MKVKALSVLWFMTAITLFVQGFFFGVTGDLNMDPSVWFIYLPVTLPWHLWQYAQTGVFGMNIAVAAAGVTVSIGMAVVFWTILEHKKAKEDPK